MEPAGGIANYYFGVARLCGGYRVEYNGGGVSPLLVLYNIHPCALRPDDELIYCRCAKCIGGSQHNAFALCLVHRGELAYCGGFADTVHAYHKHDGRNCHKPHILAALKHLRDDVAYLVLNARGVGKVLLSHSVVKAHCDFGCRGDAHIPHDKCLLKLVKKLLVNGCIAVKHVVNRAGHIVAGFSQPHIDFLKNAHQTVPFYSRPSFSAISAVFSSNSFDTPSSCIVTP